MVIRRIDSILQLGAPGRLTAPILRFVSAAALAALAACTPPAAGPATPPPQPTGAALDQPAQPTGPLTVGHDTTAEGRIKSDIAFLASPELGGRGTGDAGAVKAAEFIARRFGELKIEPFGDAVPQSGGAVGRAYSQLFEARVGANVAPAALRVTRGKDAPADADAAAIVTADGSESDTASGAAVFVGYGITAPALNWDDYAGADVAGKIVVVLDGAPKLPEAKDRPADALRDFGSLRYKLRTARERKAAGLLVVTAGDLPKPPNNATGMGIPGVVITRAAAEKLLPGSPVGDKAAWEATKAGRPKPIANTTVELTTKITPRMAKAWNVIGIIRARQGSPRSGEFVLIGAHYDHLGKESTFSRSASGAPAVHPGADDNASGTAMLLEVARRLAILPHAPDRNVIFAAFGAEEIGAIGSRHFVEHPPHPFESMKPVVAMINADMIGRMQGKKLIVDGVGTSPGWDPLVKAASDGLDLELAFGAEGFGASDHASFTAARVPVAFLFTGVHDDYHQPSDTPDKINLPGAAKVATLGARLVLALAQQEARLVFQDAPADPHRSMRGGFRASLGTIPDYAFQGKGVKITGARPDSPAARAGMQAGDVIVKIGTHDVTNIHDFMFSLKELEPGREVVIQLERAGARVSLKVIPAPGK